LDAATLLRELGRLVEVELLYQRGVPPQATYTFKHALIQDTASQSLLRSTRQGYHRRIAEVLAERFPETVKNQPELLAHHYTEAGLNAQAVSYWYKAAQRAVERSAHVEAIRHLRTGLALLQTLSETSERAQRDNWLRVLDTAECSQVDQRVRQQLHAVVPLLDALKAEQQPLELVFPRKRPLDTHA
jgi:predicted ATPase